MICFRPDVDFLVNGKPSLAGRQNFIFGVITTSTTAAPSTTTATTVASNTTSALASPFRYNQEADGSYILRDLDVSAGWPMFSHSTGYRPTYSARWLCSASPCSATWSAPPTWGHTSSSSESRSLKPMMYRDLCHMSVTSACLFNIYGQSNCCYLFSRKNKKRTFISMYGTRFYYLAIYRASSLFL